MKEIFEKRFFTQFTKTQLYLMAMNFLLVFFLIYLSNIGLLPIKNISDFLFFSFLFLFFALYRPGWAFLFFVGTIALENVNLAPTNLEIAVRPYQFFGAIIISAILVRLIARRLNFSLEKPKWYDLLVIVVVAGGFISVLGSPNSALSFKLFVVFSSFAALYFLVRNYVRDIEDLKKIMPVFLGLSLVVVFYAMWQNMRFSSGLSAFEVMPGRPNATFAEADWLGIYLVLIISLIYALTIYLKDSQAEGEGEYKIQSVKLFLSYLFLIFSFVSLIITVSRSAWLGALAATFAFLFLILTNLKFNPKFWRWKTCGINLAGIITSGIIAVTIVYFFNLTSFQLFNRVQSTGLGLQKITISCKDNIVLPEKIDTGEELIGYGCRHINLEEIKVEEARGYFIKEIYRKDPNVNIRKEIYVKSWEQIKNNPILGIGWGSIGNILGTDERGASLNASNIFLEVWLGTGIIGFVAFLILWSYIILRNILNFIQARNSKERVFTIFVIVTWFGLTIANLFNSGIMLGFLWLFIAVSLINLKTDENRN